MAHRILDFNVAHLDVALTSRPDIAVTHYPLNYQIIDSQFLQIARETPPISVPTVPSQSRAQCWRNEPVGNIVPMYAATPEPRIL
ncbi:MAG: hypothetical protein WCB11_20375 [Terriglobales bacterium]